MTTTTEVTITRRREDDGSVTILVRYWSVHEQRWTVDAPNRIPDRELAAMPAGDRAQVLAVMP